MTYAIRNLAFALTVLLLAASITFSQHIPPTEITTLTGVQVVIPKEPVSTKPLLLIVAFSRKGGDDTKAWNQFFKTVYENDPRLDYYELADLQGAPQFVRKFIVHGMRGSVPEPERSHLAPIYAQNQEWKKLVGYGNPNIGYLVLADGTGRVLFQIEGPASTAKAAELETAVEKATQHR